MPFVIHYENTDAFKSCTNGIFSYQGVFFRDNCIVSLEKSLNINDANFGQSVKEFLNTINGFFNFIIHKENTVYIAVDRVRSMPLFYSNAKTGFYVSNDANWLKNNIQVSEVDSIAKEEFLLTGYVTGADTLFPEIRQVQAGELLVIEEKNDEYHIASEDYYIFHPKYNGIIDEGKTSYFNKLDTISINIVKRLISFAKGKQIVIPLSAGRDSRLIALTLKKLGYENVLCFSYGKKGNFESCESQIIAERLGYSWHFVEYTPELEKIIFGTKEGWRYQESSGNLTSVPHFQDLMAVKMLVEKQIIEDDAVFCPGHTGDFVSGGHIPREALRRKSSVQELVYLVMAVHYNLFNIYAVKKKVRQQLFSRILSTYDFVPKINAGIDMSGYYERWDWRERQAKYIVNSVKVYEFYGHKWWIPLWDKEFIEFWESVPFTHRMERKLYNEYVDNLTVKMIGYLHFNSNKRYQRMRRMLVSLLDSLRLKKITKRVLAGFGKVDIKEQLKGHPNVSVELYNDKVDIRSVKHLKSFIGINAYLYLKEVTDDEAKTKKNI